MAATKSSADIQAELKAIKKELKDWEHDFLSKEGRKPEKKDIANDKDIARKYKSYAKLKAVVEGKDAPQVAAKKGDAAAFAAVETPSVVVPSSRRRQGSARAAEDDDGSVAVERASSKKKDAQTSRKVSSSTKAKERLEEAAREEEEEEEFVVKTTKSRTADAKKSRSSRRNDDDLPPSRRKHRGKAEEDEEDDEEAEVADDRDSSRAYIPESRMSRPKPSKPSSRPSAPTVVTRNLSTDESKYGRGDILAMEDEVATANSTAQVGPSGPTIKANYLSKETLYATTSVSGLSGRSGAATGEDDTTRPWGVTGSLPENFKLRKSTIAAGPVPTDEALRELQRHRLEQERTQRAAQSDAVAKPFSIGNALYSTDFEPTSDPFLDGSDFSKNEFQDFLSHRNRLVDRAGGSAVPAFASSATTAKSFGASPTSPTSSTSPFFSPSSLISGNSPVTSPGALVGGGATSGRPRDDLAMPSPPKKIDLSAFAKPYDPTKEDDDARSDSDDATAARFVPTVKSPIGVGAGAGDGARPPTVRRGAFSLESPDGVGDEDPDFASVLDGPKNRAAAARNNPASAAAAAAVAVVAGMGAGKDSSASLASGHLDVTSPRPSTATASTSASSAAGGQLGAARASLASSAGGGAGVGDDTAGVPEVAGSAGTLAGEESAVVPLEEEEEKKAAEEKAGALVTTKPNQDSGNTLPFPYNKDVKPVEITNPKLFSRVPLESILRCKLYRKKNLLDKAHPSFFLYNEADDKFLLAARKRKKSKSVNYLISTSQEDLTKDSEHYAAKLRANFQRTNFILYDARHYNKNLKDKGLTELACVTYSKTVLPREMEVAIPSLAVDESGNGLTKDIMADIKSQNTETLMFLQNKPPRWNETTQSHCLNFGGRVTQPSIKNFQLILGKNDSYIVMQFGRCGPDYFTLDVCYPMTPMEAFAIALTTFDAYDSA
ncbi:hypothetical protein HDU96_009887 [Phlyctochytrium bullatum]|nr:hypothetical protein HDU96_009887 [Phlyctochytrium bullatum]